ncbi:MAG: acyltransferase domain-containing protein [Bacteroidales bacterium]|nr:acyltransferase domain-containing protein [Bacteroidales bacterium]
MEQLEYTGFEIAIIGMSGQFPGDTDINNLWEKLAKGEELITFFSDEELLKAGIKEELVKSSNYVKANSFIKDREYFDSVFFEYSPDEVLLMDPQMRLFHQNVYEALESAGYDPYTYNEKIGLFAGASDSLNWEVFASMANNGNLDRLTTISLSSNQFMPTRISHKLNLKGPSVSVYTACSSSLVAICNACNNLLLGESKIAIAGSSKLFESAVRGYTYEEGFINSPDGHCRTFSANSKGTVPAEGVGVIVLKRLQDAIDENDNILAVIKGYGLNNDGSNKQGYVSTSPEGQSEAILIAQKMAGVDSDSISYVEAHGTGTEIGDPIEVEALIRVFGKSKDKSCALGSIKTNLGHMDSTAGVGGVIKTVLALKNRKIPPSLNFDKPNPKIDFENSPFYVNTSLIDWESKYPLRAGVSSFGIGGTNAHVILEEAPNSKASIEGREFKLIQISGKTESAMLRNIEKLKLYIEANEDLNLHDVAYTLQVGRASFLNRAVCVCKDIVGLKNKLNQKEWKYKKNVTKKGDQAVIFMFSGQGAQYVNMCKDLYNREKEFKNIVDECFERAITISGINFKAILFNDNNTKESTDEINKTINTQPLLFIIEYAISKLLIGWGLIPDCLIGHSIGEYAAACISGVFSFDDALKLVIKRGQLMQGVNEGSMLSVSISENELKDLLKDFKAISIAASNSDTHFVVSGEDEEINAFKIILENKKYSCQLLKTSHAFHSSMMDGILDEFKNEIEKTSINEMKIPIISNLTGEKIKSDQLKDPSYWSEHLRKTVLFSKGIKGVLEENKKAVFIEVGPGMALSTFTRANKLKSSEHKVLNLIRHPKEMLNDNEYLMNKIGELWLAGIELNYEHFYRNEYRKRVSLPTYSFEKIPYLTDVNAFNLIMESASERSGGSRFEDRLTKQLSELMNSRKAFKAERPSISSNFEAPQAPQEIKMSKVWEKLFGISDIGLNDDFFELGGDSLRATTLLNRIFKEFGEEVSLKQFFAEPTMKGVVDCINKQEKVNFVKIQNVEKRDYYPMGSAQKRLYFLHEFDPTGLGYNIPQVLKVEGKLNKERMQKTFNRLIDKHESLRTEFMLVDNEPMLKVSENINLNIEYYRNVDIDKQIEKFIRPFDIEKSPLFRAGIIEINNNEYILMVDVHHLVCDGISLEMLIKDFVSLYIYDHKESLNYQYRDYTTWLDNNERKQSILLQKEWWLNEFKEDVPKLELFNGHYDDSNKSQKGNTIVFEIGKEKTEKLYDLARSEGTTQFMLLLSLYNILLSKISQREDIVIGTPVAGRVHADLENIIGMFVNTLVLRNFPKGELTFREFLSTVKDKVLQVFDNQEYTYDELINELKSQKIISQNSLFDVSFDVRNIGSDNNIEIEDFKASPYGYVEEVSLFDIALNVSLAENKIELQFNYRTDIFELETINKFYEYLLNIIDSITSNPDVIIQNIEIINQENRNELINKIKIDDSDNTENESKASKKLDVDFDF